MGGLHRFLSYGIFTNSNTGPTNIELEHVISYIRYRYRYPVARTSTGTVHSCLFARLNTTGNVLLTWFKIIVNCIGLEKGNLIVICPFAELRKSHGLFCCRVQKWGCHAPRGPGPEGGPQPLRPSPPQQKSHLRHPRRPRYKDTQWVYCTPVLLKYWCWSLIFMYRTIIITK